MNPKHFLALFLLPTLAAPAAAQVSRGADPCLEARRIAESPACLAGAADCQAAQRWQQVFGTPGTGLADPQRTGGLAGKEVRLEATEDLRSVLTRLAAAAGLELLTGPRVTGELRAEAGTLPLGEAWRKVLDTAGLVARFEEGKVLVARADRAQGGTPRRQRSATLFNCPTR
ncbi:MAG TPA: hypothetical protein VEL74_14925 [Thermoanaerobaculia bacterium]|nr:hypothetical protein [Thermoanaerobaculia bacterium]